MSQADARKEAKSCCCTPPAPLQGQEENGKEGASERKDNRDHLPAPAAAQTLGWAHSPSCVFVFISPFSTLPRSRRALPLLLRPVWPRLSPPCPLYLGRPPLVHRPAGLPLSPPERTEGGTAEEAAASCRLGSPPRRRRGWCGGGGALASQSPWPAGRGQGRRGLDLPSREAGAPPRVPRSCAGRCPGLPPLPGRPGIPGHPASSRVGDPEGDTRASSASPGSKTTDRARGRAGVDWWDSPSSHSLTPGHQRTASS